MHSDTITAGPAARTEGRGRRCANLESGKCVRGDVKRGHLDICEEVVELLRVQRDLGQGFVSDALPQHDATIQGDLWRLVPADNHVFVITQSHNMKVKPQDRRGGEDEQCCVIYNKSEGML